MPRSRLRPLAGVLLALLAPALAAQEPAAQEPAAQEPDRVVLKNGDALTGKIKTLGEGKLTFEHPSLGDLEIAFENIADLTTGAPVTLVTTGGERIERRVTGIVNNELQLAPPPPQVGGPVIPVLARQDLSAINPPPDPGPQWTGAINVGLGISTGNTEKRNASLNAEAERRTEKDRMSAKGLWIYEENKTDGEWDLVDRILQGQMKYDYFLTKQLYLVAIAAAGSDYTAGLDLRFTMGGGLGYQWFDEECFKLFTEGTINFFSERFDDPSADSDRIAARLAYGLRWKITDDLEILQDVQYFPSLEDKDDLYVTKDTRARLSLTESMFTQAQWLLEYDNTPNTGNERLDNVYLLSLGWKF